MKSLYSVLVFALFALGAQAQTLDFNNLQFPGTGTIDPTGGLTVFAQAYEAGLTDATSGAAAGIECWIGVSTTNTNPNTWAEASFTVAPFFGETGGGNNDEFSLSIGNGLAPGTYYYASRFRLSAGPFTYGGVNTGGSGGNTWDGSTFISGVLTVIDPTLDFVNVQFPASITVDYGKNGDVFTQAYELGVTEAAGAGAGITAEVGVFDMNTDPATWPESAFQATTFNAQIGNNDEYKAEIGADLAPGTYYYASRYTYNTGSYTYGGYSITDGGTWDGVTNVSGVLTVSPIPAVFINEVDADDAGSDDESFVEVFGPASTALDDYVLVFFNGSNDLSYRAFDLDGQTIGADGYFVFGNPGVANVDQTTAIDFMQNGPDAVALFIGSTADFPNGTAVTTTAIVDAMVYDTDDDTDDVGLLALLLPGQPQLNENGASLGDIHSNARVPDGGIQRNTSTYVQQIASPGSTNVVASCSITDVTFVSATACSPGDNTYTSTIEVTYSGAPAIGTLDVNGQSFAIGTSPQTVTLTALVSDAAAVDITASFSADPSCTYTEPTVFTAPSNCLVNALLINEVDYDQEGTDTGEFIELYNSGATAIDLTGYTVDLINGGTSSVYKTITLPTATVLAGEYYVICFGSNASAYCDFAETGDIQNGGPDAIELRLAGSVLDVLSYEGSTAGHTEGTGNTLEDDLDFFGLSRIPNGTDTDDNSVDFDLVCLTPGSANQVCPGNDECANAIEVTPSLFGTPSWLAASLANATESLPGCSGDADDDVWFTFEAGDASDVIIVRDPNATTDLVVELFDACEGNSLGCFDAYGAGSLERALHGALVTGSDYWFRVYDKAAGASTSTDIEVMVKTWADAGISDFYCGGTEYTADDFITPKRQDLNELYPMTNIYVGGYRVRLIDPLTMDTTIVEQVGFNAVYFQLQEFMPSPNTLYEASASHRLGIGANGIVNFAWSDYGPSCTIGLGGVKQTKIRDVFCDNDPLVGYDLEQQIQAEIVQFATAYRFTLTDGVNTFVENNVGYGLFLYEIEGIELNTTYSVTVQARVDGVWSAPGAPCNVSTAAAPAVTSVLGTYCGETFAYPTSDFILTSLVYGATAYEWQFVPEGPGATLTEVRNALSFYFHTTTLPLVAGETYDVSVRARVGGLWGAFSSPCSITIEAYVPPASLQDEVSGKPGDSNGAKSISATSYTTAIYPNPSDGHEVILQWERSAASAGSMYIELTDISGKQVRIEQVAISGTSGAYLLDLEGELMPGVYLVKTILDGEQLTERLMVR